MEELDERGAFGYGGGLIRLSSKIGLGAECFGCESPHRSLPNDLLAFLLALITSYTLEKKDFAPLFFLGSFPSLKYQ